MTVNITIDTCTWINLATNVYEESDEILEKLSVLIDSRKIALVIPSIIIDEWKRNKHVKVTDKLSKYLTAKLKSFKEIKSYLDEGDREQLNQLITRITDRQEYFNQAVNERVEKIERFFSHPNTTVLPVIDDVKKISVDFALKNQKPFSNRKNSMGDSLIIFSIIEYMKGQKKPIYFITDNKEDFANRDCSDFHEDLREYINSFSVSLETQTVTLEMYFHLNIATALNTIEANLISKEVEHSIQEQINTQELCPNCGSPSVRGSWSRSLYGGLSWWLFCNSCKRSYDTGEFFD